MGKFKRFLTIIFSILGALFIVATLFNLLGIQLFDPRIILEETEILF